MRIFRPFEFAGGFRQSLIMAALVGVFAGGPVTEAPAADRSMILQSTTSTQNAGLYETILPIFEKATGIRVHVVAVGTGQALRNARKGDGDVLLVHAKADEEKFVRDGFGVARHDVMFNDFILVGPTADPAGVAGQRDASKALSLVATSGAIFASRGDNSGTHKKERALWAAAGIDPTAGSGAWYREMGSGMGATLNAAVAMGAYTLTDRGTWISFKNKRGHEILMEGDKALFNQYGVILINPARHPSVKAEEGQVFIDWLIGPDGQTAIASHKIAGQQLFFPNAK